MPPHKHEPVPEADMEIVSPRYTICQTLREAYHLIEDERGKELIRTAVAMAKQMSRKLSEYKEGWEADFWDPRWQAILMTQHDWANTGYRFWMSLEAIGVRAIGIKGEPHPYVYPKQMIIHKAIHGRPNQPFHLIPELSTMCEPSPILHYFTSTMIHPGTSIKDKKIIVNHGGTMYRQNSDKLNSMWNPIIHKAIVQCPDLLGLGAKDEVLIYYPVDTNMLKPRYLDPAAGPPYVVGHFPSNSDVKGSANVAAGVRLFMERYPGLADKITFRNCADLPTTWMLNLARISECDIVIEGCAPTQNGKRYGEWANTALEAAALGKAVITHCGSQDVYAAEYGTDIEDAIMVANSPDEISDCLCSLAKLGPEYVLLRQQAARGWVERNHSLKATGERLWEKVYRDLLEKEV